MEVDPSVTLDRIEEFIQGFWWILPNVGIALMVFLLFLAVAAIVRRSIQEVFRRRGRPDLARLLAGSGRWVIVTLGLLVVATIVFPSVKPADILATLGIGSIAIGFAFKDILQNWLAGLLILLRQPFRQGDQISIGETEGTVERIESRATLLTTFDGKRVIIPNSDVYTQVVTVQTAFSSRRSECDVGIGYGDDIDEGCAAIVQALKSVRSIEQDPPPEAIPWELAGSSVNIRARWWSLPSQADVVATRGHAIRAIKSALDAAGIDMPFPTNTILFHDQTEATDGNRQQQREGWPTQRDSLHASGGNHTARLPNPARGEKQSLASRRT